MFRKALLMFPNVSVLGVDLYWLTVIIGVIAAMAAARLLYSRAGVSFGVFRYAIIVLIGAMFVGYVFAVLFQSWYAYLETGIFEWGIGATFYGGLIGAVAVFVAAYFGIGHFVFKDKRHVVEFHRVVSLFMPCVALAQGFGRIGCLFTGCCYGIPVDGAGGIFMFVDGEWQNRVPTQLYEALFLFALFAALVAAIAKNKLVDYTASIYLIAYGVFRFAIEYVRDDYRGASGIPFLTPSQLTAVLTAVFGGVLIVLYKYILKPAYARVAEKYGVAPADSPSEASDKTSDAAQPEAENGQASDAQGIAADE